MKAPTLIEVEAELARRQKATPEYGLNFPDLVVRAGQLEPAFRKFFLAAIHRAQGRINVTALAEAVRTGNAQAIFDRLYLDELRGDLLAGTTSTLRQGFMRGAATGANQLRKVGVQVRFDFMDAHAVQWAQARAGQLITAGPGDTPSIMQAQRTIVQTAVAEALREGRTVQQVARDLKQFMGLNQRQADALGNYRLKLTDQGVDPDIIDARVNKYSAGLLNRRVETIARTEIIRAASYGQRGQLDDAANHGLFDRRTTKRVWIATLDDLVDPHICLPMDGETVEYDEPWVLPDDYGTVDVPSDSHPNCRCSEELIFEE